jgi:O-acetylhomoserine/O-acetylserine sulfhydrylase-like pyridoxal-dependent enzyme
MYRNHIQNLYEISFTDFPFQPTVDVFEKRIAALEGGVAAVAASSGQVRHPLYKLLVS